mmetsp:Transcript_9423/g.14453  ORF Transcript_9423/g.14453 Transcript_9423/m.14453 type:complete len:225 (+) Transcript_9423:120-794(+)
MKQKRKKSKQQYHSVHEERMHGGQFAPTILHSSMLEASFTAENQKITPQQGGPAWGRASSWPAAPPSAPRPGARAGPRHHPARRTSAAGAQGQGQGRRGCPPTPPPPSRTLAPPLPSWRCCCCCCCEGRRERRWLHGGCRLSRYGGGVDEEIKGLLHFPKLGDMVVRAWCYISAIEVAISKGGGRGGPGGAEEEGGGVGAQEPHHSGAHVHQGGAAPVNSGGPF